jgi:hypothetical protein
MKVINNVFVVGRAEVDFQALMINSHIPSSV